MPTKLIEVALPLDVINREAAREKSIRHGHPSTLHLWWARRPCGLRAVSLPSSSMTLRRTPTCSRPKHNQERERQRLFDIIARLVSHGKPRTDERILEEARGQNRRCYPDGPPPISTRSAAGLDPPGKRSGSALKLTRSDLNPSPCSSPSACRDATRFAGRPPVHPLRGTLEGLSPGEVHRVSPKTCASTVMDAGRGRTAQSLLYRGHSARWQQGVGDCMAMDQNRHLP